MPPTIIVVILLTLAIVGNTLSDPPGGAREARMPGLTPPGIYYEW
ncbi:hypothetical protein [Frankia sp. CiP1_Cm_nod1]